MALNASHHHDDPNIVFHTFFAQAAHKNKRAEIYGKTQWKNASTQYTIILNTQPTTKHSILISLTMRLCL